MFLYMCMYSLIYALAFVVTCICRITRCICTYTLYTSLPSMGRKGGAKDNHLETAKGFELLELLLNSQTATI